MSKVCGCGKGHASEFDGQCCFCREISVRRAVAKKYGVKHRGDGMTVEQFINATADRETKSAINDFGGL